MQVLLYQVMQVRQPRGWVRGSPTCGSDEAEEMPHMEPIPGKFVISQSHGPNETMRRGILFKIPDGCLRLSLLN